MPKDKSPAGSAPSSEDDRGASPATTSAKPYSQPKSKRFASSSPSSNGHLTAESREEIRQQARQKLQERRQRREAAAAAAADNGSTLPPMMAGPSSYGHRSNDSPSSSSDGAASGSSSRWADRAPPSSGSSFFSSASNIGIEGGQFSVDSSSYRNSTSLTINLHHGPPVDNVSVYENPFDPLIGSGLSSSPGSTQHYPYPMSGFPYYHVPSPFESQDTTGRSFPSTRYIRDGFIPTYPYGANNDWSTPFSRQDPINNSQSTGSGSSGFANPVGAGTFQNMAAPPLSQSSSSSSASSLEQIVVAQEDLSTGQLQDQSESSELQTQKSSDIYCRHLSLKQRGFPLWIPEPNCYLPIQYQRKGISVGDVGIITAAGSFDYLFNVLLPHNHPFNAGRVPPGFAPLFPPLHPSDIRGQLEFRSNSFIASSSVRRTLGNSEDLGTTFHISASEGAILTIPDGALSEDLGNLVKLRSYMSENVESWYRHANGPRGRELANGDLRLVIGCDKTTAWGMAAFANLSQGEDTRLRFKPVGTSQFQTYGWELHSGTAEVRSGPDAREIRALSAGDSERGGDPRPYENQCIFVRTLNATLHDKAWLELTAELSVPSSSEGSTSGKDIEMPSATSANPGERPLSRAGDRVLAHSVSTDSHAGNDSSSSDGTNDRVTVHKPEVPAYLTSHPSKSLNAAILQQYMDAKMAITDDSDWSTVLTENDIVMPKPRHLTERILANSTLVRDARGVVYLEKNVAPLAAAVLDASQAPRITPLRLPTPPTPFSIDLDDMPPPTRYTTRMAPMRHQSGSPSSM